MMNGYPNPAPEVALVDVLSELFFGDEEAETLETTLNRLVSAGFRQRVNGKVYGREEYLAHVREMRATVIGGRTEVIEQVREGNTIAGRYLFHVLTPDRKEVAFESCIFARIAPDGTVERLAEVARVVEADDDWDVMSVP